MRKVAISNIAWPAEDDREALTRIVRAGFTGLEIAPAKVCTGWPKDEPDAKSLRHIVAGEGLQIIALQSVLFGVKGVELFESPDSRNRLGDHLRRIARLAGALGARACVYGAPQTRDPGQLPMRTAIDIAAEFFCSVAPTFESEGCCLTIEANVSSYGCRFITCTSEAIDLVRQINRAGIRVQIDTGTIFSGLEAVSVVSDAVSVAGHVHASEPELRPLGAAKSDHAAIAEALEAANYDGWISVEMRSVPNWRETLTQAARVIADVYHRGGANSI